MSMLAPNSSILWAISSVMDCVVVSKATTAATPTSKPITRKHTLAFRRLRLFMAILCSFIFVAFLLEVFCAH